MTRREAARAALAAGMEHFYRIPFEYFERYSPYGTPEEVAEFLAPYVEAGCAAFNLIPCASDEEAALEGAARSGPGSPARPDRGPAGW